MMTILSFLAALAVLIVVHEYGHYRVARACGVRVLRFSVGFGKPLLRWRSGRDSTEFVLAVFPLGGYVKMLDEREMTVAPEERHLAFNTQSLGRRSAIVAAGPLANLALAVLLYAAVNWMGVMQAAPVLPHPTPDSLAAAAEIVGGDRVTAVAVADQELEPVRSFEEVRWLITQAAVKGQDLQLQVDSAGGQSAQIRNLALSRFEAGEIDASLMQKLGISGPYTRAELGEVVAGGAAARAGLQAKDEVLSIDGRAVHDGAQLRRWVRESGASGTVQPQRWKLNRGGVTLDVTVQPDVLLDGGTSIGRIAAYVGSPVETVQVEFGWWQGLEKGWSQTWEVAGLTLNMMGQMLTGQASVKNLSGPLTIADYAGRSAAVGLAAYLTFLALISVSLGVLNLLPLPVLDGGHLMYYLWEWLTGRAVSDLWAARLQQLGVVMLGALMALAIFNDVSRLIGA